MTAEQPWSLSVHFGMEYKSHRHNASRLSASMLRQVLAFTLGCVVTAVLFLNAHFLTTRPLIYSPSSIPALNRQTTANKIMTQVKPGESSVLDGKRVLVAIASYDFSQNQQLIISDAKTKNFDFLIK